MEAIAKTRYLKGSPRKARLVIDLVRGKNVSHALAILKFTNKRAADPIEKCLRSAIANATYKAEQENIAIDPDDLWIKTCFVDMGPTKNRRRLRPAPQGRAYFERRHYCHITIEVTSDPQEEKEEPVVKSKKKAEKKGSKPAAKKTKADSKTKPAAKKSAKSEEPKAEKPKAAKEKAPAAKATKPEKQEAKAEEKKAPAEKKEAKAEKKEPKAVKKQAKPEKPAAKSKKEEAPEAKADKKKDGADAGTEKE